MSVFISADSSPRHHLLKATFFSALVAVVVLVLAVLPAEYGLDPTGIGTRLGLTRLADAAEAAEPAAAAAEPVGVRSAGNAALAEKAGTAFGASAQQAFAAEAVSFATTPLKTDSMDVTLPPGKGVEVKRSQLDTALIGVKAGLNARGQSVTPDQLTMLERQVLNDIIGLQILLERMDISTIARKAAITNKST